VHVNELLIGGRGFTALSDAEASALVDQAVDDLRATGVPATGSVMRGTCFDVANRIVEAAQAWSASDIVLGSRRRSSSRLARFRLVDGITQRVTSLSPVPVTIAPAPLRVPRSAGKERSATGPQTNTKTYTHPNPRPH
jgi:nucleotide-binding universal stress UspA family protein